MITERREQRAFEAFVADASGRLMRTAYLLCGDRGHAEDLVQTALFRTARRWHRARQQPEAYARRVVMNLAQDRWRSLGRRPGEAGVDLETLEALETRAADDEGLLERVRLLDTIRRLPPGQQAVLTLRFLADLSVAETAATLDCSEGNVKSQTSRALDRIRDVLDQEKENADADR